MNQETYREQLISKIINYINDKEIDSRLVASSYADLIIRYVHAEPEEVLETLDQAIGYKNNDFSAQRSVGQRYLALPIGDSGLQIRCYFQEKFPSLKFRVAGERSSFLGLKKERNGQNIIVSAGYDDKRQEKGLSDFEINNETYTFNPNGTLFSKNQRRITPAATQSQKVDISRIEAESEEEAKQLDFLNMLYFCMVKNRAKVSANLSVESLDVLFTDFFKQAKELLYLDEELDFYEVMRAMSQLIFFKGEGGPAASRIKANGGDDTLFETNEGRKTTLRQGIGENIPIDIHGEGNENNFYDTVICDESGKPIVRYMFMQTPEGFSIFRSYLGTLSDVNKKALTIALYKNQFRIAYSVSPKFVPAVIELRFNENGSVDYEFSEVKSLGSSGFEKPNAERLQNLIESEERGVPSKIQ